MNRSLFKKEYIQDLCTEYNAEPRSSLSQYYLIEEQPIRTILKAGNLSGNEHAVELGPGFGALTFGLCHKSDQQVIAFEIDEKLKQYWQQEKQKHDLNLRLVFGEGVKNFEKYNEKLPEDYKFFSNLPYHLTSHAMKTILESPNKPSSITVMMQREVAERICQQPGDMSLLSVSVQFYGEPEIADYVSPQAFWPQPEVESAILHVDQISGNDIDPEKFFKVVKAGFKHKRKQLKKNFKLEFGLDSNNAEDLIEAATEPQYSRARAQKFSVPQWKEITKQLDKEGKI